MDWLRQLPTFPLLVVSVLLGLAPLQPQPHLIEKLGMLVQGTLVRPIDIFDLILHGTPLTLLIIKLFFLKAKPVEK